MAGFLVDVINYARFGVIIFKVLRFMGVNFDLSYRKTKSSLQLQYGFRTALPQKSKWLSGAGQYQYSMGVARIFPHLVLHDRAWRYVNILFLMINGPGGFVAKLEKV